MKKLAVLVVICLLLSACGAQESDPVISYDELGNTIYTNEDGLGIDADNLPCAIPFNDKNVYLKGFELCESKSDDDTYSLYSFITLDVSELEQDEINDLRNKKLDVSCYIDSAKNGIDFSRMTRLGNFLWTNTKELVIISVNSLTAIDSDYYYSFKDNPLRYSVYVYIEQQEEYEVKISAKSKYNRNKTNKLYYYPDAEVIKSAFIEYDDIDPQLDSFIEKCLLDYLLRTIDMYR